MLGSEKLLILPFETDFMKTVSKDKLRKTQFKRIYIYSMYFPVFVRDDDC